MRRISESSTRGCASYNRGLQAIIVPSLLTRQHTYRCAASSILLNPRMPAIFKMQPFARALVVSVLCAAPAYANSILRCQLEQGGEVRIVETSPGSNPYAFKAIDLDGRFRFRAVMVGKAGAIDYVKLYAYYRKEGISVLMHQVTYHAPVVPIGRDALALTGVVTLYAPPLGRELQYSCELIAAER